MSSSRRHILLVEEHRDIRVAFVALYEELYRYAVHVVDGTREALGLAKRQRIDLAVVDLAGGSEVKLRLRMIRSWREDGLTFPVIAMSALDYDGLGIESFEAGADDFLRKPFHFADLTARIQRRILRRVVPVDPAGTARVDGICLPREPFQFAGATVHPDLRITFPDGTSHTLTAKHVGILRQFAENAGSLVLRDKLITDVWGPDANTNSDSIHQYLHRLRKIYRDAGVDLSAYVKPAHKAGWRISKKAVGPRSA